MRHFTTKLYIRERCCESEVFRLSSSVRTTCASAPKRVSRPDRYPPTMIRSPANVLLNQIFIRTVKDPAPLKLSYEGRTHNKELRALGTYHRNRIMLSTQVALHTTCITRSSSEVNSICGHRLCQEFFRPVYRRKERSALNPFTASYFLCFC